MLHPSAETKVEQMIGSVSAQVGTPVVVEVVVVVMGVVVVVLVELEVVTGVFKEKNINKVSYEI